MGKQQNPPAESAGHPEELGQQLRRAREACRLTITSAAASLRLPPRVIEALEAGDFKQYEPVYVRGYLRNYARLLELSAEPLIESYNRSLPSESPSVPAQKENPQPEATASKLFLILAAVALPLILWILAKAFLPSSETAPPPLAVAGIPADESGPAVVLPGQTAGGDASSIAQTPSQQGVKTEAVVLPAQPVLAEKTAAPPAKSPDPAPVTAAPSQPIGQGPDSIALRLSSSAWVSVRDQTGRKLVYENLPAGAERTYAGQAPFTVVLGNYSPTTTKIEFNGQPYEPPKAKAGAVARFTLGDGGAKKP